MAQCLLQELKQQWPNCLIDVLAPQWCAALIDHMPQVNRLIPAPFAHGKLGLLERRRLGKKLALENYNRAYVLPNSLKSALVPWFAGIPLRIGFVGEQRYGLLNRRYKLNKTVLPTMVQRFVALARDDNEPPEFSSITAPRLVVGAETINLALQTHQLSADSQVLALCPGAEFGPAKQWPAQHYAAVARYYLDQGWQVWLFGSTKDNEVCAEINAQTQAQCSDLSGKTSLSEAVALLATVDLAVSNDSGLMHIAAALHKPLVAVYGSTDPGFTPPLNKQAKIVRSGLECSPCFERICPLKHLDCLIKLKPNKVLKACHQLITV